MLRSNTNSTFVFTLCSDLTNAAPQRLYNEVLEAINPSYRLYGICIKTKGVAKSATQEIYYEVPKIYVFLTYFPFVGFFVNALTHIVGRLLVNADTLRNEELECLPNMPSP